jgi:hypothetical protein
MAGIPQSKQAADRDRKFLNVRSWQILLQKSQNAVGSISRK